MALRDIITGRFNAPLEKIDAELVELPAQLAAMKMQLTEAVVQCAVDGDFTPAKELGGLVRATEQKIAALHAERAATISAEQKRIEAEKAKEAASTLRAIRAKLGEVTAQRKELDGAIEGIARQTRKFDDTFGALTALLPDIAWPPGSGSAVAEAVKEAVEIASTGESPPSIEQFLSPLYTFIQTQIAEKEH